VFFVAKKKKTTNRRNVLKDKEEGAFRSSDLDRSFHILRKLAVLDAFDAENQLL